MNEIDNHVDALKRAKTERSASTRRSREQCVVFLKSYASDVLMKSETLRKNGIAVELNGDGFALLKESKFMHIFPNSNLIALSLDGEKSANSALGYVQFEDGSNSSSEKLTEQIVDCLVKRNWINL